MSMALLDRIRLINDAKLAVEDIKSDNILLGLFHLLSFAYYEKNNSLTSDAVFDKLCRVCLKRCKAEGVLPELKKHRDSFKAGTGFGLVYAEYTSPPPEYAYFLWESLESVRNMAKSPKKKVASSQEISKKRVKIDETYSRKGKKKRGLLFK